MGASHDKLTDAPIGVFDSGVGGLSVLRHICAQLPGESIIYVADSAHAPYGDKSPAAIRARADALSDFLLEAGAKAIVVACNTATAAAVAHLRARLTVPIIGMEPAVKPAVAATRNRVVGVLATTGTLKSAQFAALLDTFAAGVEIVARAGHGLVECVERGELDTPATRALLEQHLAPLIARGADTLVLGCTHYPYLRASIEAIVGDSMAIIDTGEAVARQLARQLEQQGLAARSTARQHRFWTTGDAARAQAIMSHLWGAPIAVRALE